jgi:cysteine desulfurase
LLYGGGQERGLRAGTLPTQQVAAMGEAFRIAGEEMATEQTRIRELRDRLWRALRQLGDIELNGHSEPNLAGILNVTFSGIAAEALLADLPDIAVSTGSACTSAGNEPSHVLRAMGRDAFQARGAVRFSLGRFTTAAEIDYASTAIGAAVCRLRDLSPLWAPQRQKLDSRAVDWMPP